MHPLPHPHLRAAALRLQDREAVLAHFLRLGESDRRMRFLQATSDAALRAHVATLDFSRDPRFAVFAADGRVVALVEGFVYAGGERRDMEVAFSTDAPWRRLGLARYLWNAMAGHAQGEGIDRLVLHCDGRNASMRRLLSSVGASAQVDDGEVDAVWPLEAVTC